MKRAVAAVYWGGSHCLSADWCSGCIRMDGFRISPTYGHYIVWVSDIPSSTWHQIVSQITGAAWTVDVEMRRQSGNDSLSHLTVRYILVPCREGVLFLGPLCGWLLCQITQLGLTSKRTPSFLYKCSQFDFESNSYADIITLLNDMIWIRLYEQGDQWPGGEWGSTLHLLQAFTLLLSVLGLPLLKCLPHDDIHTG